MARLAFSAVMWKTLTGAVFGDELAEIFFENPVMQELRKRLPLSRATDSHNIVEATRCVYEAFGGQQNLALQCLSFGSRFKRYRAGKTVVYSMSSAALVIRWK